MAYDKTHMKGAIKPMGSGRGGFSSSQPCCKGEGIDPLKGNKIPEKTHTSKYPTSKK